MSTVDRPFRVSFLKPAAATLVGIVMLAACQSTPPPTGTQLTKAEIEESVVGAEYLWVNADGSLSSRLRKR